ncbi:hypothetical protein QJS04_geneDACA022306 [Acorus gramineus]|uniref:Uncharacterized protein n=1 Tax=Acorus gramineus TaxID=55184 RepID=A0AAV9B7Y0_ACOGR|nr:hypothetical protein QJS04_geneDACA022306 [Acorus gramineus]
MKNLARSWYICFYVEEVEKESQVADASGSISYRPLRPNRPVFSRPRGRPYTKCDSYYGCRASPPPPPPP